MKYPGKFLLFIGLPFFVTIATAFKKNELGSWKEKQLITPEALVNQIKSGDTTNLVLLNTGPVEDIQGAITIGAVEDAKNLAKLKEYLKTVPTDKQVVIYCGCCPLSVCPNLKPAYDALKEMKFKNYKVLRLTHDLQEDWMDKGYPTQQ